MSNLLYFAYGSNLYPNWLNSRVTSALPVSNTSLNNWKLCFHKRSDDGSAKCNIIKTDLNDDVVHGTIYEFNSDEKIKLDEAEGGYTPEFMKLDEFGDVLIYLANTGRIENNLPIYTWYHDIVFAGAQFHDLPITYIEYIKSFKAINDPDTNRDKEKRSIAWPK
jgi:hypothetical protein